MAKLGALRIPVLLLAGVGIGRADERLNLRESAGVGQVTHIVMELRAEGEYRPSALPGAKPVKSIPMKVHGRLDYVERVVKVDADGSATRVVRLVREAASAANNELRHIGSQVRPEVSFLIAERRAGGVVVASAGGPLTRPELELVQATADPLSLRGLLPEKPVAVGDRWAVGAEAARGLSDYDALAGNALEAKLEASDASSARISLGGDIRGASRGGEGTIHCTGSFTFDRKAGRIDHLILERTESRKPSQVESGLEVKSTLTLDRAEIEPPPALTDQAIAGMNLEAQQERELLLLTPPDGRYALLHDRDWFLVYDDDRQVVLKRLDRGEPVAQCNLKIGPNAGRGRHQDLDQFRSDIRRALGARFGEILEAREVEGAAAGGFRYRVLALGREGDLEVLWAYYLIASSEGDQLLATFTFSKASAKQLRDQDLQMIGSLVWKDITAAAKPR
jgi:hypothetical protein